MIVRENIEQDWGHEEWIKWHRDYHKDMWLNSFLHYIRRIGVDDYNLEDIKSLAELMYIRYEQMNLIQDVHTTSSIAASELYGWLENEKDIFKKINDMKPLTEAFKNMPPKSQKDFQSMKLEKVVDMVMEKIDLTKNGIDLGYTTDIIFSRLDEYLGEEFVIEHSQELSHYVERAMIAQLRYKVKSSIEITLKYK